MLQATSQLGETHRLLAPFHHPHVSPFSAPIGLGIDRHSKLTLSSEVASTDPTAWTCFRLDRRHRIEPRSLTTTTAGIPNATGAFVPGTPGWSTKYEGAQRPKIRPKLDYLVVRTLRSIPKVPKCQSGCQSDSSIGSQWGELRQPNHRSTQLESDPTSVSRLGAPFDLRW